MFLNVASIITKWGTGEMNEEVLWLRMGVRKREQGEIVNEMIIHIYINEGNGKRRVKSVDGME